jgi:hypothetical protein
MDRRDFLAALSGMAIVGATSPVQAVQSALRSNTPLYGGWLPNPGAVRQWVRRQRRPYFRQAAPHLRESGIGKRILLWKFFEAVTGSELEPHFQGIGDCVSHGWGLGIDILTTVQMKYHFLPQKWIAKSATELIYTGSRVNIGGGLVRGDGSYGIWAADWCREHGNLLRQPYLDGKYDFTTYDAQKARDWAHLCPNCTDWGGGVPDDLVPLADEHPVRTTTLVTSWPEARDAVANGYPVTICSDVGYNDKRDRDGFAQRQGTWYHCMLLAGIDTVGRRPGGCILNSWGEDWIDGPTRLGQPKGSFWAEAADIDRMLKLGDSFAISNYQGYPRRNVEYRLY